MIVLARRWDGIGARLKAILNAWSMARALGQSFQLVWPADVVSGDPRELFDDAFLRAHQITDPVGTDYVAPSALTDLGRAQARDRCGTLADRSVVDVSDCVDILCFADESQRAAQERFHAGLDEIGWSRPARALIEAVRRAAGLRAHAAIHIRAGDIVTGAWRQFVPVEKYLPTPYVEEAIERLSGPERHRVVVVSDHPSYVHYLKTRFDMVLTPGDLIEGYAGLTELQQGFADILVLSRAQRLAAPGASGFSQLAVRLGNLDLLSIDRLIAEGEAQTRLRDGIAHCAQAAADHPLLRPLLARDICWFLDVFADQLAIDEQRALAALAVQSEPEFCGALNRLALAQALKGECKTAAGNSRQALRLADGIRRHDDPLVESLAVAIALTALGGRRFARLLRRLSGWRFGRRFIRIFDQAQHDLRRCGSLRPYQIDHAELLDNLRCQLAFRDWLLQADRRCCEIATTQLERGAGDALLLSRWRPSGFVRLQQRGAFPQGARNVEAITVRFASAFGAALHDAPARPSPRCQLDGIAGSASGLRWLKGWAYDPDRRGASLAVACRVTDATLSAAVTCLPRPDVAAALQDRRALHSGFMLPLPLGLREDDLRPLLRFYGAARR